MFGSLLNDISIQRLDKNGRPISGQLIKVPISFGPKQKWLVRLTQDPNAGATASDGSPTQTPVEIVVPRMGFDLKAFSYDNQRELPSSGKNVRLLTNNTLNRVYNPVAYIFPFELTIATKSMEDMFQIVEQILPFFTPTFTVTVQESQLSQTKDIVITLKTPVTPEIEPYGDPKESKLLTCTLNFELAGYLYGPQIPQKIITQVDLRLFADSNFMGDPQDIEDYTQPDPTPPDVGTVVTVTPNPLNTPPEGDFGFTTTITEI